MKRPLLILFAIVVGGLLFAQSQGWITGDPDFEKTEEQTR